MVRFKIKITDYDEPIVKAKTDDIDDFESIFKKIRRKINGN